MNSKNSKHNLSLENISYEYNGITALKSITTTFETGTLNALIGPNGSGKTTLLKVASGLLDYSDGAVKIGDCELNDLSIMERSRLIGFAASGVDFPFDFRVRDAVSQGRSPHLDMLGNLSDGDEQIINGAIQRMSLDDFQNRSVNQLSQGEKERVVIARLLAQNSPVMLFDENFAHLDLKHRLALISVMKKLVADGKTIIVALHDIEFAARHFPKITLMRSGGIVLSGTREQAITSERLSETYDLNFKIISRETPEEITIIPSS